ncbi:pinensin family lanthipeptide [Roseivirga sp. BDSF3-8]|uniref:pinensin family lanthipeptide n=1 Tax=Roseivirga sp. BDSF3-8 TaxID=3241598 RepID=UPI003532621C
MKKTKMNLESLNIESFVTESNIRGGAKDAEVPTVLTKGYWSHCCTEDFTVA